MKYESIEEGMAIVANDTLYLVVATDLKIRNITNQSITLYDTDQKRLVYPSLFTWERENKLWTDHVEIQEIIPKDRVNIGII